MEIFKVTRVFADENGESHFEEIAYPLTDAGPIGFLSDRFKVKELVFRKVSPTYDDFHTAPQRQYVVLLDEGVEIETSLGEKRVFSPGEILVAALSICSPINSISQALKKLSRDRWELNNSWIGCLRKAAAPACLNLTRILALSLP